MEKIRLKLKEIPFQYTCQTHLHFILFYLWRKNAIKARKMSFFLRAKQGLTLVLMKYVRVDGSG